MSKALKYEGFDAAETGGVTALVGTIAVAPLVGFKAAGILGFTGEVAGVVVVEEVVMEGGVEAIDAVEVVDGVGFEVKFEKGTLVAIGEEGVFTTGRGAGLVVGGVGGVEITGAVTDGVGIALVIPAGVDTVGMLGEILLGGTGRFDVDIAEGEGEAMEGGVVDAIEGAVAEARRAGLGDVSGITAV